MKKSIRKRILPGLAVFLITLHITSYAAHAGELSIPNLISLSSSGPNEMTVVWEGVENAEGYRIYRASGSEAHQNTGYESDGTAYFKGDFDYVEVGLTDGTARSFTDETAIPGRSYEYTVEAFTAEGSGGVRTGLFGRTNGEVLAAYDLRFTNVTSKGFDVSGRVVSPTSVEKVMIAVWTKSDGQDDIEWKELKPVNGRFQTHVNTKVHKNEPGLYCVNVIPYDTEGRNPYDFGDNSETVGSVVVPENVPMLLNPAVNGVSKEGYEVALTYYAESEVVRAEAETYAESEGEAGKKTTAASVEATDHIIRARINASDHGNAEGLYHTVVRMTTKDGRVTSYEIPVIVKDAGTELSVTFIDVGFGDSILLESRGKYLLVDAGHSTFASNVLQILKEKRIDKVTVLTTHLHFDHVCGILPLIDAGFVSEIYADTLGYSDSFIDAVNVEKALDYAREKAIPIHEITKIDSFTVGDALIERIGPLKSYGFTTPGATNNRSIWLKVTGGGATYLLAGDAESVAERDMIAAGIDMKADYLKVSHHGLETSSTEEFILASSPKMTFVSDNLIFSPERHGGVTRWE
ncbi:MAG: GBS Bsp-like repeat-containing protein, partial [Lachnospiraceae bacterium]|nr:GBS Bsp-like repeat-containing protein [Lachnospiraceae bacterium]